MVTDQDIEQLKKLMQLMDEQRIGRLEVGDVVLERVAFTPRDKDKPKSDSRDEDEDTPFGYPKSDLL